MWEVDVCAVVWSRNPSLVSCGSLRFVSGVCFQRQREQLLILIRVNISILSQTENVIQLPKSIFPLGPHVQDTSLVVLFSEFVRKTFHYFHS